MAIHSCAGTKRERCPTLVVATTKTGAPSDKAWAARMTSASMVLSPAVGWPRCRAVAHNSAAFRMAEDIPRDSFSGHYQRTRTIATGLLLGMASLFVAALMWEPAYPSLAWLRAFAEAAMVGAWPIGTR